MRGIFVKRCPVHASGGKDHLKTAQDAILHGLCLLITNYGRDRKIHFLKLNAIRDSDRTLQRYWYNIEWNQVNSSPYTFKSFRGFIQINFLPIVSLERLLFFTSRSISGFLESNCWELDLNLRASTTLMNEQSNANKILRENLHSIHSMGPV
jgi:hypothetical protein